jgi:hypothetical protein
MNISEILFQIPPMLYLSLLFFPAALFGFFSASKVKNKISAAQADPAEQLKERRVDAGRESKSALFLGAAIALAASAGIFIYGIIGDYQNQRGIFAAVLPAKTFPPAPNYVFPPAPALGAATSTALEK